MADAQQIAHAIQAAVQAAMQQQGQDQQIALQQIIQQLQPAAPTAATFARAPALANAGIINYSSKEGAAIFKAATAPLEIKFSILKPNVGVLLSELKDRASTNGWADVLTVNNIYLLDGHGRVTLNQCENHADTYINASNRNAQNDYQLLMCLKSSMDETTTARMANESNMYTRPGILPHDPANQSGLCYLKHLLNKALADARSVSANIRNNLALLPTYIIDEAQQDIIAFNEHVKKQVKELEMRGETSSDTLYNLFRAYEACTDESFKMYMSHQRDEFESGRVNLTPDELMEKAEQKYKNMKLEGKWNKPTPEQEEIIALRAQVVLLEKKRNPKKDTEPAKRRPKKDASGKPVFEGDQAWRNNPPKHGEQHTKQVAGKTWKYCSYHGYWCSHDSEQCKDKERLGKKNPPMSQEDHITAAMASIGIEDVTDDTSDTEE